MSIDVYDVSCYSAGSNNEISPMLEIEILARSSLIREAWSKTNRCTVVNNVLQLFAHCRIMPVGNSYSL